MRYILLVFLGACSYGVLSTFVKLAYDRGFDVGEVTGSQMFLGFVMTWLPALFFLRSKTTPSQWLLLLGVGLTIGSTGLLYYSALQYIPASIAIVLLFQFTWMGVLFEAITTRKRPTAATWFSLVLLLIGTILAGGIAESGGAVLTGTGVVLGLLSALSYTLFIVFSGKAAVEVNPWLRSAIMSTGSLILTMMIYPPTFLANGSLFNGLFLYGFLLAFFGVLIPTACFNIGVPRIGAGMASILGAAELPTAVLSSSLILQESVSLLQWLGVVIILLGIVLPEWVRHREKKKTPSLM
jgi:drug/metabolite transporter (DMT)-like permease